MSENNPSTTAEMRLQIPLKGKLAKTAQDAESPIHFVGKRLAEKVGAKFSFTSEKGGEKMKMGSFFAEMLEYDGKEQVPESDAPPEEWNTFMNTYFQELAENPDTVRLFRAERYGEGKVPRLLEMHLPPMPKTKEGYRDFLRSRHLLAGLLAAYQQEIVMMVGVTRIMDESVIKPDHERRLGFNFSKIELDKLDTKHRLAQRMIAKSPNLPHKDLPIKGIYMPTKEFLERDEVSLATDEEGWFLQAGPVKFNFYKAGELDMERLSADEPSDNVDEIEVEMPGNINEISAKDRERAKYVLAGFLRNLLLVGTVSMVVDAENPDQIQLAKDLGMKRGRREGEGKIRLQTTRALLEEECYVPTGEFK